MGGGFCCCACVNTVQCCVVHADFAAPPVNGDEQEQPDNVHKVPVPCGRFEPEMFFRSEMAELCATVADIQEDRTHEDVEAVEPCSHEECRGEDAFREAEMRMGVFVDLKAKERCTKQNGQAERFYCVFVIAFDDGVVCPRDCAAGKQQDHGHHKRQVECRNGMDVRRRPYKADAFNREQGCGEKCPEERDEEHHLGGDEQGHTKAEADFRDFGVCFFDDGFIDHVFPPEEHADHDCQHAEQRSGREWKVFATRLQCCAVIGEIHQHHYAEKTASK